MIAALDAFGSDNAPLPEVEGAVQAIKENVCEKILLVGKREVLEKELKKFDYPADRIEIVHAQDVISMDDKASTSVKKKKDSSLVTASRLHKEGLADFMVSAGNTGAVMASSLFTYGRIKNVMRPAIAMVLPTLNRPTLFLDVGANVDCTPEHLVQFAILGRVYSRFFYNREDPEVALLNIGEESSKGNELAKKTYSMLQERNDINFVGNIEGKQLLDGNVDVVVCDGFVGNVMLKTVEGVAMMIMKMLKEQIQKDWLTKIGAFLAMPAFKYLKTKLDHSEYGGALLFGLNGNTIIAHGSSNSTAIMNAIKFGSKIAESGFIEHAVESFMVE